MEGIREVNERFTQQAKILNECLICDRNNICAVLGECFSKMDIIKALPQEHRARIKYAKSFGQVINVLLLTEGAKYKLKSYYIGQKITKAQKQRIEKQTIKKKQRQLCKEYKSQTARVLIPTEKKFKFTDNNDFVNWYREQKQEDFYELD